MLIYEENNELLLPKMQDYKDIFHLDLLAAETKSFTRQDDRFHQIKEIYEFKRDIHHITYESLREEVKRRFNIISAIQVKNECNSGCQMYLEEYPFKVYYYQKINPNINYFFSTWDHYKSYSYPNKSCYDLSKLFGGMENYDSLSTLFNEQDDNFKQNLYENFLEFAIFYYEIFPYLKISEWSRYDLTKLQNAKEMLTQLKLNTDEVDFLLKNREIANNNSLVMKLIKKES